MIFEEVNTLQTGFFQRDLPVLLDQAAHHISTFGRGRASDKSIVVEAQVPGMSYAAAP